MKLIVEPVYKSHNQSQNKNGSNKQFKELFQETLNKTKKERGNSYDTNLQ